MNFITATAQNIALVEGTGTVCATGTAGMAGGTTAATGWNFAANGGFVNGGGGFWVFKTATPGDNVCLCLSSTGQTSGVIGKSSNEVALCSCPCVRLPAFGAIARSGSCVSHTSGACTLSAVSTGDVVLAFWFNNTNTTVPTIPSGWISITTRGTIAGMQTGCHYATSGADTSVPAATNSSAVAAAAYSGTATTAALATCTQGVGNAAQNGSATGTTGNYPADNQERSANWFVGFMGNKTATTCTPTGMTLVTADDAATPRIRVSDTNAAASGNWASTNCTVTTGTSRVTAVVELAAACSAAGNTALMTLST
jgi:hypothetical protein